MKNYIAILTLLGFTSFARAEHYESQKYNFAIDLPPGSLREPKEFGASNGQVIDGVVVTLDNKEQDCLINVGVTNFEPRIITKFPNILELLLQNHLKSKVAVVDGTVAKQPSTFKTYNCLSFAYTAM
jgi:hypothetical protein